MAYDPSGYPQQRRPYSPAPYGAIYGRPARQPVVPGPAMRPVVPWQPVPPAPLARSPEPVKRPSRRPHLLLATVVLVLAGAMWTAYSKNLVFKDSGIKACEALREGGAGLPGAEEPGATMTEPRYRHLRKVFGASRYHDIRDHGTKLMDVIWAMSQATDAGGDKDAGAVANAALLYLEPLGEHLTGLQSACADQGIIVNLQQTR